MPFSEKGKQSFQPAPLPSKSESIPPRFNPPKWTDPVYQPRRIQRPMTQKPFASKPVPKTLFGEKKHLRKGEFLKKATEKSFGSGGKMLPSYEREKILKKALPASSFYVSEQKVKERLRELKRKEGYAKGEEKAKLKEMRQNLEKGSGFGSGY